MVMAGSACEDVEKVKQVLDEVGGDADAAMEYLIAQQGSEESLLANDELCSSEKNIHGELQKEKVEQLKIKTENKAHNIQRTETQNSLSCDDKKIPRNKTCPCGSKKKYKSCCGSVAGKSSVRLSAKLKVDDFNSRKDRKQRNKAPKDVLNNNQSVGGPPDMGALCI
ncbi:hypothetical protein ACH5RR_011454 [Cinchona calisaya]|uniref:Uncharacterized protein n=1 Tax=Cinchona calisaya TaxID=153742 RepID=A0ABD3A5H8_9GENT